VHRPEGKQFWIIEAKDDPRFFTCFVDEVVKAADGFVGTAHKVRLSFKAQTAGEKSYLNVVAVGIADAASPAPPPAAADELPLLTADDIPFGRP
jgi:hypothetical protein